MKTENDKKSNAFYDIENDKSKGVSLRGLTAGNSPTFTQNEKGEIEFEIEVPTIPQPPVEEKKEKKRKHRRFFKVKKEIEEVEPEEDEIEELDESEEEIEYDDEEPEEEGIDSFRVIKRTIKIIVITALVVTIGLVIWGVTSPTFNIKTVKVEGPFKSDRVKIMEIASGDIGSNIFTANYSSMKSQIEKLPYIYEVVIDKKLPDEIILNVTERAEFIAFSGDNEIIYIDQYGYVMSKNSGDTLLADVPITNGVISSEYNVGDTIKGSDMVKFRNIQYFFETAQNIGFNYKISRINYSNSSGFTFTLPELSIVVKYGEIDRDILKEKISYLMNVIETMNGNYKGNLDISAENYLEHTILEMKV